MRYNSRNIANQTLIELYEAILLPRKVEEKMLVLLRQGKISKWFAGIGQEAISVGVAKAMQPDEYILPMHRNLGVFTTRNVPLHRLFAQFQGKMSGFTKGRDRSFHFGTNEHHIVGMISHLGPQMGVADGIALSYKLKQENKVVAVFTGDGGTSEGDFHEALNVAAVWQLPVIFVVENNGYGLSTPISEQFRCKQLVDRAKGYGMKGIQVDGNNVLDVYRALSGIAEEIREQPQPYLVECMTFRMRGHEEASGTKYVPKELFEAWEKKDPVSSFEKYLLRKKVLTKTGVDKLKQDYTAEIDKALHLAFDEEEVTATDLELKDVYRQHDQIVVYRETAKSSEKRLVDAISDGLKQSMERYDNLVLMGQDIAEYGGVFKITEGFVEEFGKERVRNTPLCESAIVGAALGLSIGGMKSMVEMQFADFVSSGFTQVVNNLAKTHYRWGQHADVVIRMPCGAGVTAGPFHSQSNEAWFYHTPGLKVVYPSNPIDAKGLIAAAIEDPNPVLFFEHKFLYRSISAEVPDDYYTTEIGKAALVNEGDDLSIITYGLGVHWAKTTLEENPDIEADLLDLRTLVPLDWDAVRTTVQKTGKVVILHEDTLMGGIGGDIAAWISENCFEYLDAPVMRCGALDTPVPFTPALEQHFLPAERFKQQLKELFEY